MSASFQRFQLAGEIVPGALRRQFGQFEQPAHDIFLGRGFGRAIASRTSAKGASGMNSIEPSGLRRKPSFFHKAGRSTT
jgi:hypothetical protein